MGSHYRIADAPSFGMGTIRNVTVTRPLHVHVHVQGARHGDVADRSHAE